MSIYLLMHTLTTIFPIGQTYISFGEATPTGMGLIAHRAYIPAVQTDGELRTTVKQKRLSIDSPVNYLTFTRI